jgi:hypothetical protein
MLLFIGCSARCRARGFQQLSLTVQWGDNTGAANGLQIFCADPALFACLFCSMMWKKHWEHHNMCGQPHEDPDFHKGESTIFTGLNVTPLCYERSVHTFLAAAQLLHGHCVG